MSGVVTNIEVRSGVNEAGEGFCPIVVTTSDGRMHLGQLDPENVRTMALNWLGAAEAAESDAIVYRILHEKVGLDLPAVGQFIADMRDERG